MYEETKATPIDVATSRQVPDPVGFRILVKPLAIKEKTDGGIIRPGELVEREEVAAPVGLVIKLGPTAYKDPKRFPDGAYCKEGDFVIFRSYSGTRLKIHGQEFRLINDDTVEAVVDDPRGIQRA